MLEITSNDNSQYKIFKSLLQSKGIKEHRMFILSGEKLIHEFLQKNYKLNDDQFQIAFEIVNKNLNCLTDAKSTQLSPELFKELDVLGTHYNLLILKFNELPTKDFNTAAKGLEIVTPLGDPRNLGALIRTCAGFGVQQVILTAESTHPFLPQCLKASAGSVLNLPLFKSTLKINEIPLVEENFALELHGTSLEKISWPKNLRLWIGEEGPGLKLNPEQKKHIRFIHIPTQNIESLNATVSSSLAIWEWRKNNC